MAEFDEDDNKRRRNLVTASAVIIGCAFFDVELTDILAKTTNKFAWLPPAPWKVLVAGLVALAYLTYRFAMRDQKDLVFGWPDWKSLTLSQGPILQRMLLQHLKNQCSKPTDLDGPNALNISLLSEPLMPKLLKAIVNTDLSPIQRAQVDALAASCDPKSDGTGDWEWTATLAIRIEGRSPRVEVGTVKFSMDERSLAFRWMNARSWVRTVLGTNLAVDLLLPYYLAAGAAATLIWRFLTR